MWFLAHCEVAVEQLYVRPASQVQRSDRLQKHPIDSGKALNWSGVFDTTKKFILLTLHMQSATSVSHLVLKWTIFGLGTPCLTFRVRYSQPMVTPRQNMSRNI